MFKKLSNAQLELCVKCAVCSVVVNVVLSKVVSMLPRLNLPVVSDVLDVFRENNTKLFRSSVNVGLVVLVSCYFACCM